MEITTFKIKVCPKKIQLLCFRSKTPQEKGLLLNQWNKLKHPIKTKAISNRQGITIAMIPFDQENDR